jgi:hypothetical protein
MHVFGFRFARPKLDRSRFDRASLHRLRNTFAPRKPRHPLLRLTLGLLGLAVLAALVFVSVFVGIGMLAIGLTHRLWKSRKPLPRDPRVVEGDYRVVAKPVLADRTLRSA